MSLKRNQQKEMLGKAVTTLRMKERKGYTNLNGFIDLDNGERILLSIACDSKGNANVYTNKENGQPFVYLNLAVVKQDNGNRNKRY